ncbi:MAG: hypothetical protein LBG92_05450 [Prevotellaceae bacterium]|jgi:hypothetical protein|nr:hypothetical protein [Prevotellaceae bacterium]
MKHLLIISALASCICFTSCGGGSQQKKTDDEPAAVDNDLKKEIVAGKADSIRQRVYWCLEKFGRMEKGKLQNLPVHDFLKVYNKAGFLIEETHYNANNEVVNSRKITYDDANLLLSEEVFKGTELSERIVYTYNDRKNLTKKEKFDKDGNSREWTEYVYYKDSDLLMDEDLYKDGKLTLKYVRIYEGSTLTKKQKYWGGGSLAQTESYTYDSDSHLSSVLSETYKDKVLSFEKHVEYKDYTPFGEYEIKIEYDGNGCPIAKTVRSFDNFGNLTSTTKQELILSSNVPVDSVHAAILSDSAKIAATETQEGENENEDGGEGENENSEAFESWKWEWVSQAGDAYEYTYDEKHNWTQKITYKIKEKDERVRQFYFERIIYYR